MAKTDPELSLKSPTGLTTNGLLATIVTILKVLAAFDLTKLITLAVIVAGGMLLWFNRADFKDNQAGIIRNQETIIRLMMAQDSRLNQDVAREQAWVEEIFKHHARTHKRLDDLERLLRKEQPDEEVCCPMPPVEE